MVLYPVVLCGGGGARLWPASRPNRPKQFIPMAGNRTLFQEAVARVAPLVEAPGRLIVVGGVTHRSWILRQLHEIGVEAKVLLEPEPRDSGPAMAAAAAWICRADPEGIAAFVASDHYVPDQDGFRNAITAAASIAAEGRIVTLGVRPTAASTAYGYIQPKADGAGPVVSFVEKPDAASAAAYIEAGYLWNSGNFVARASTLLDEIHQLSPLVHQAAVGALPTEDGSVSLLGATFAEAPRISIDYAVMEKTSVAEVLPVDFGWSDLGSWDVIAASGHGETGLHVFEDADGCLARAPDGVLVAALGVRDLAIIVEPDAVLVADLRRAQEVKRLVERVKGLSPVHVDFRSENLETLPEAAQRFSDWLRLRALPLWATVGLSRESGFAEALGLDGRNLGLPARALIQSRQVFAYTVAGRWGWGGPWRDAVALGLDSLNKRYVRQDGTSRALVAQNGSCLDDTARLYDHAFFLLACATAKSMDVDLGDLGAKVTALRTHLVAQRLPQGGYQEAGAQPYQANAQMHLLEAVLAWEESTDDAEWSRMADELVDLARTHLVDRGSGYLREFFNKRWQPADGDDGRLVEPGHQFEWAWLFARHAALRGSTSQMDLAHDLYARGKTGVSVISGVVQDALNDDGTLRSGRARLWPQTEWLKASLLLAEVSSGSQRAAYLEDAAAALRALWLYLRPDGLWRDKRLADGGFIQEAVPASSFYHILAAFDQLAQSDLRGLFDGAPTLTLR